MSKFDIDGPDDAATIAGDAGDYLDELVRELRHEAAARYRGYPAELKAARFVLDRLAELARQVRTRRAVR